MTAELIFQSAPIVRQGDSVARLEFAIDENVPATFAGKWKRLLCIFRRDRFVSILIHHSK